MKTFIKHCRLLTFIITCHLLFLPAKLIAEDSEAAKKSTLLLTKVEKDSTRQVTALVTQSGADAVVTPVKGIEIHFFAKKSFGLLPLGDAATTDESGQATVDFPKDLPGDSVGNLSIIAKVEENPKVGEMEESIIVPWGTKIPVEHMNQRALWASAANAPWPLVIAVTSLVGGVWAVIFYIVILLFKIKNSGKYETV